ncbi:hypothetical protein B0A50_04492 [Salinomyces thailandicus]|uniref:methionyl-tRNA formyltransferase n=1 Tax=Salinomyces thailandicus TaxID=706561 RepID=A0A4U0TZE1_9PEZI|nr:hypothetical protein B0A50_04492 [Salinomyces thailandica]
MLLQSWRLRHASRNLSVPRLVSRGRWNSTVSTKHHEPLRILFCGADQFSIYSLRALHELQNGQGDKIASIDVVCRPDKRTGRGLKQISEVPIKRTATELEIELHQIDSFKGWEPPKPFDLIVAVSFGLLVPARLLSGAKYGGVNVHPSLLPDLRGPAPIQHTLLRRCASTGVTLQTMHPTRFDHGMILDRFEASVPPNSTPQRLVEFLGPLGADLLARGIAKGIFVPPYEGLSDADPPRQPSHAPKIMPEDRHIDWGTWTSEEIQLRDHVLGRLWDTTTYDLCMSGESSRTSSKRVSFVGPWRVHKAPSDQMLAKPGLPVLLPNHKLTTFGIWSADSCVMVPQGVTIQGEPKSGARQKLAHALNTQKEG